MMVIKKLVAGVNGIENIVSSGVTIIVHGVFSILVSRMDGEC